MLVLVVPQAEFSSFQLKMKIKCASTNPKDRAEMLLLHVAEIISLLSRKLKGEVMKTVVKVRGKLDRKDLLQKHGSGLCKAIGE